MTDAFEIATERDGDELRLLVRGELDIATAPRLAAAMPDEQAPSVLLDLSGVSFMDSTGLRAVLALHDELGERLRIVASEPAMRLFVLVGADARLPLQ
jgi:anti-anti-sigma factor